MGSSRLLLLLLLACARAYRWSIDETYVEDKLSFSEMFMYGSDRGPWPLQLGDTTIDVDLDGRIESVYDEPRNVSVGTFTSAREFDLGSVDLCSFKYPRGLSNMQRGDFVFSRRDNDTALTARLKVDFTIKKSGLQYVVVQVCDTGFSTVALNGAITFRNPYGYLPAMYFGFLPFEFVRAACLCAFQVFYLGLLIRHREKLLALHYAILAVSLIATAEACVWFAAYLKLNMVGDPLCCPFAEHVVAAMSLEMLRRTASRTLLLVVSLGFGLVRPRLSCKETLGVLSLTLGYLLSGVLATVEKVRNANNLQQTHQSSGLDLPVLVFDLIFLVWIYLALIKITEVLHATGQTYKLEMYTRLAYTIATFVLLVSLFTVLTFLSKYGVFRWPWALYWAQTVPLEVLNLVVVAAVCVIWRPTERSKLLAEMHQLSTSDSSLEMPGMPGDEEEEFSEEVD